MNNKKTASLLQITKGKRVFEYREHPCILLIKGKCESFNGGKWFYQKYQVFKDFDEL